MQVSKKYVVYELNSVMGSEKHKALEKIEFKGFKPNRFDTEGEAIIALIEDKKTYSDYIIVSEVYITDHNED